MAIVERVELEQDVRGPALAAVSGVKALAAALGQISPQATSAARAQASLVRAQTAAAGGMSAAAAVVKATAAEQVIAARSTADAARAAATAQATAAKAAAAAVKSASAEKLAAMKAESTQANALVKAYSKIGQAEERRQSVDDRARLIGLKSTAARQAADDRARLVALKAQNAAITSMIARDSQLAVIDAKRTAEATKLGKALEKNARIVPSKGARAANDNGRSFVGGSSGGGLSSMGLAMGTAAIGVAQQAAAAAVRMAGAATIAAFNAAAFKEDTLRSFTLLTGSAAEARRTFEAGMQLSSEIGGKPTERLAQMQTLLARGFKLDGATGALQVLRGMADLKVISPQASTENIVNAIAQIQSKGKLQLEELQGQLGEQFDVGAVIDEIGKKLGKTDDQVRALISAGKIDANTGILAVLDAIQVKTGKKLGGAAADATKGISGLRQQLESWPDSFLMALDVDGKRVTSFMQSVVNAVDPTKKSGKALVASTNELADAVMDLMSAGNAPGGDNVESIVKSLAAFEGGIAAGIKQTTPALTAMLEAIGKVTGMKDAEASARLLGQAIGYLTVSIVAFVALAVFPFIWAWQQISTVINGIAALSKPAETAGQSIGNGIVRGLLAAMTFGISEVFFVGTQLGAAGPAGTKVGAKVRSPSTLTFATGGYVVAGYVNALEQGRSLVARAGMALGQAAIPSAPSIGVPTSAGSMGGGRAGGISLAGGIHVHLTAPGGAAGGQGSIEAQANVAADIIMRKLRGFAEAAA